MYLWVCAKCTNSHQVCIEGVETWCRHWWGGFKGCLICYFGVCVGSCGNPGRRFCGVVTLAVLLQGCLGGLSLTPIRVRPLIRLFDTFEDSHGSWGIRDSGRIAQVPLF